jgi:hypothetical protein
MQDTIDRLDKTGQLVNLKMSSLFREALPEWSVTYANLTDLLNTGELLEAAN